jgi:hypothetical protein
MARGIITTLGLAGAAFAAWYFLDGKKGAERRENFMKSTKDLYDSASDELGRLGKDIASGVSDAVDRVGEMTGKAGEALGQITGKAGEALGSAAATVKQIKSRETTAA